jgi:hypothetical protein
MRGRRPEIQLDMYYWYGKIYMEIRDTSLPSPKEAKVASKKSSIWFWILLVLGLAVLSGASLRSMYLADKAEQRRPALPFEVLIVDTGVVNTSADCHSDRVIGDLWHVPVMLKGERFMDGHEQVWGTFAGMPRPGDSATCIRAEMRYSSGRSVAPRRSAAIHCSVTRQGKENSASPPACIKHR